MQDSHEPANTKERQHEPAKALSSIPQTFTVGTAGGEAKDDAGQQSKQDGRFEMIEIEDGHV